MHFHHLLFALLIGLFVCVLAKTERITTYRELSIVENPTPDRPKTVRNDKNDTDVSFYVEADEHLGKLKSQAEELRDTYNDMIKRAYGIDLQKNRTIIKTPTPTPTTTSKDSSEVVGGSRKAAADWVRAAINPMLLNSKPSIDNNSSKEQTKLH